MKLRAKLGALEERPFRLLWLGRTTSSAGDALAGIAAAFAVIEVGGSASDLGLIFAAATLARIAFILVGGVWADRLPRRFVMIACDVVRAAVNVFLAVALLGGSMELWMFYVTAPIFGAAQAFFGPASMGLVPQTISPARLQQANALLALSHSGTSVFGPALSGIMIALWSPGVVFAVDALTFVGSTAALARLPLAKLPPLPRKRFSTELAEGWRETWSRGWMRVGLATAAVANLGIAALYVLGPVLAAEELGGAAAWGLILTGGAAGGVLGGLLGLRFRPGRPLVACFLGWSLGGMPLLALAVPLPVLAIAVLNGGFFLGLVFANAVWETVVQREIPPERLSRVSSFDFFVSIAFMPIGQALAGPLAEAVGRETVLVGAAALIVLACAAGLTAPSVRGARRPSSQEPALAPTG